MISEKDMETDGSTILGFSLLILTFSLGGRVEVNGDCGSFKNKILSKLQVDKTDSGVPVISTIDLTGQEFFSSCFGSKTAAGEQQG